jgi:hypothetical protein
MKYKTNYITKLTILPEAIENKILDIVFIEHKSFLYCRYTKWLFSEELLEAHEERIIKYFNNIISGSLPFNLKLLKTLEDKNKIIHTFNNNTNQILYIDSIKIFNYILDEKDPTVDLIELKCKKNIRNFKVEDALILLINNINNDIQMYSKNWNIPIYEFYEILGNLKEISIKYIDNKMILDWKIE